MFNFTKKTLKKDGTHFLMDKVVQRGKIELVVSENIQTYHRWSLEIQLRKRRGGGGHKKTKLIKYNWNPSNEWEVPGEKCTPLFGLTCIGVLNSRLLGSSFLKQGIVISLISIFWTVKAF